MEPGRGVQHLGCVWWGPVAGKTHPPHALTEALDVWEATWAPYDDATYREVLALLHPHDVLLDIGAGDLHLAYRAAARVHRVYAIERQPHVVARGRRAGPRPPNVHVIVGDARWVPFPPHITVAVLLMRHCRHFPLYVRKLQATRCRYLITNARWGMGVEIIDLQAPRLPFHRVRLGWYACLCGAVGFITGPPEDLTQEAFRQVHEVQSCPACDPDGIRGG